MVVGFTTNYAISTYHHYGCEFESHSGDTTLGDKVCKCLMTGWWYSPGTPVSSTNKTDQYDITEILVKIWLSLSLTKGLLTRYGILDISLTFSQE